MGSTRTAITITGADPRELDELRERGIDHGGNAVEPFVDDDGGWPLRCCLRDSEPGDELAIVAWSPFPWRGPFAELGPIAIHARRCAGVTADGVPAQLLTRPQLARPYTTGHRIAYDDVVVVDGDGSLPAVLERLLASPEIELVVVRNVLAGCYSFTATLASARTCDVEPMSVA
jgi:hypothetical protein